MSTMINEKLINLNLEVKNKEEAIKHLASMIHEEKKLNCVWKKNNLKKCQDCEICSKIGFIDALNEREASFTTAVGYSFAIPHGKCDSVSNPVIAFAKLKDEIKWGEDGDEDEFVKYIFMIGVPDAKAGDEHMRILIKLSTSILEDDFREGLIDINTNKEALEIINKYSGILN